MSNLLPANATRLELALGGAVSRIGDVPASVIRSLWDAETCPEDLLPWLAWSLSVDTWDDAWDTATKRAVILASYDVHAHKGTPYAVRRALAALGLAGVEIQEGLGPLILDGSWLLDGSETLTGDRRWALFRVIADLGSGNGLDTARITQVRRAIDRAKNARSHLYSLAWRANVTVPAGPALVSAPLRVGLSLRRHQGVLDGRYRLHGRETRALDGTWSLDGIARLDDGTLTPPGAVLFLSSPPSGTTRPALDPGHLAYRAPIRVGLRPGSAPAPNVRLDGRLRLDGRWTLDGYHPGPHRRALRVRRSFHIDGATRLDGGWGPPLTGGWALDDGTTLGRSLCLDGWETTA